MRKSIFFIILVKVVIVSAYVYANEEVDSKNYVVLRYDDYTSKTSTEIEKKIIREIEKRKISCTFGVTPFHGGENGALNEYKINILKDAVKKKFIEIALHGFDHKTIRKDLKTEFYGLSQEKQYKKIKIGKEKLEEWFDTKVKTFIPPFNSYDKVTIEVLERLGFKNLSANVAGPIVRNSKLNFYPKTNSLSDLKKTIKKIEKNKIDSNILILMFHQYDFLEIDKKRGVITFKEFQKLLDWLISQKNLRIGSIKNINEIKGKMSATRYSETQSIHKSILLIPNKVIDLCPFPIKVYWSTNILNEYGLFIYMLVIIIYFLIIVFIALISYYLIKYLYRIFKIKRIYIYSILSLLTITIIYKLATDLEYGIYVITLCSISTGIIFGVLTTLRRVEQ